MSNILLSIIVPVYNVEKYLKECLESILNNYQNGVEILLINDGSTDSSGELCDLYADKYDYIKVFHKENGGLSSARNYGISQSLGKYIWFIDSDDYIPGGVVDKLFNKFEKNVDLVVGNYECFYPDERIVKCKDFSDSDNTDEPFYKVLYTKGCISYMAVRFIVKKSILMQNDIFFTEKIYHEDEDWTPRMALNIKSFDIIESNMYNYRLGLATSIMGMLNPKKVYDKLKISRRFNDIINSNKQDDSANEFLRYKLEHVFIAALNEVCLYSKEQKVEMKKEIKKNLYLLDDIQTKKAKLVKGSIKLLGVYNTSKLLKMRNKINDTK